MCLANKIYALLVVVWIGLPWAAVGQPSKAALDKARTAETSDPKSAALLKKVNDKYTALKSMQMEVALTVKDGDFTETQKGTIYAKGTDKFKLVSAQQDVIVNGKVIYTWLKEQNELQIADANAESMGLLASPQQLMKNFSTDFIAAPTMTETIGGKTIAVIEAKPKDRNSDYTKARIKIDPQTAALQEIKVFDRSNIHYTIVISKFVANPTLADTLFKFDTAKIPKGNIVDMRF